jgi:hypothetical protein
VDRACDGVVDHLVREGDEVETCRMVERPYGPYQPEVPLLHEVQERQASTLVLRCDRRYQAEVRLDHSPLRGVSIGAAAIDRLP